MSKSFKILVGLMLAEEKNCYRILGVLCIIILILFGFWWLPGFGMIWRCITMLQTVAQYKLGILGNYAAAAASKGGIMDHVNPESLDRVLANLKRAWQQATTHS